MDTQNEFIQIKKPKRIVQLTKADVFSFALVFVFTFLLIESVFFSNGFFIAISYFGLFAVASACIISKCGFNKKAIFPGVLSLLTASSFFLHSIENIFFISFLSLMYLSCAYCAELTNCSNFSNGSYFYFLDLFKTVVKIPIRNSFLPLRSLKTLKNSNENKKAKKSGKLLGVIVGLICAVPILFIVINLLMQGDAAFESVVGSFMEKLSEVLEKLTDEFSNFDGFYFTLFFISTAIFAPYIYNVIFCFRHGISKEENENTAYKYQSLRKIPTSAFGSFLGVISAVYLLYLFSQSAYFFSAFTGHLPDGVSITVTEYARRGFFEMAMIAAVNFFLIAFTVLFSKRKNGSLSAVNKYICLFLCIFTIILISTSISKILLYIFKMGLTEKRLYVFVFDIALIVAFMCIIIRLFKEKFAYMKIISGVACCLLVALSLVGTENIVSGYNTAMYLSSKHESVGTEIMSIHSVKKLEKLRQSATDEEVREIVEDELGNLYIYGYLAEKNSKTRHSTLLLEDNITCFDDLIAYKFLEKNSDIYKNFIKDDCRFFLKIDSQVSYSDLKVYEEYYSLLVLDDSTLENGDKELFFYYYYFYDEVLPDHISCTDGYTIVFKDENMKEQIFKTQDSAVSIKKTDGKIVLEKCENKQ